MTALHISDELAGSILQEASERGISVEEYLRLAIRRERTLNARSIIEAEQEWWLGLPLSERAMYEGEYIAVHRQELVDHDIEQSALYRRVREKFGHTPVLIMPAEGPQDIRVFSPRFVKT